MAGRNVLCGMWGCVHVMSRVYVLVCGMPVMYVTVVKYACMPGCMYACRHACMHVCMYVRMDG